MRVIRTKTWLTGIPDYYKVYKRWWDHYERTGEMQSKSLAFHYARVAEEMGQVLIEDDTTHEVSGENR